MNIMNKVTRKGLQKNKTRTLVTIIGVILSAAMFTAVTTFISSLQNYLVEYTIAQEGDWHGLISNATPETYESLMENKEVDFVSLTRSGGFALLQDSSNKYKPYLHVLEMDEQGLESLPVRLIGGRMPKNENEVVISEHITSNGGVSFRLGDTLTLDIGQRILSDGTIITVNAGISLPEDSSIESDDSEATSQTELTETLSVLETRSFTIVGICDRPSHTLESYNAAGYSIITTFNSDNISSTDQLDIFIKAENPKQIFSILEQHRSDSVSISYNYDLLRFIGASNEDSFNAVFYSLGAILITLIMVGSISLIYNSFAISVSERKKLFGLLSSTGATAKQRWNSVFYEALIIAVIGIPIGVLSGIAGIGTTLYLLRDLLDSFLSNDSITLHLSVSTPAILIAVAVSLTTILLSAYIPAMRSKKVSPMDAIRQATDIKLTAKQLKTSKLTRKIFGLEGDLALKNLKRNQKRYRSTVISLFLSVVLFISASSFATYLTDSVTNVYENAEYDLNYYVNLETHSFDTVSQVYHDLLNVSGVSHGSFIEYTNGMLELDRDQVEDRVYNRSVETENINEHNQVLAGLMIYSVDHDNYQSYLSELGLKEEDLINSSNPSGILIDQQHYYNSDEERYNNTHMLKDQSINRLTYQWMTEDQTPQEMDIEIVAYADLTPFGVSEFNGENMLILIIDETQKNSSFKDLQDQWYSANMYFAAKDPGKAYQDMIPILTEAGMSKHNLYNAAEALQGNRNMITIISVFAYGFITLISLITIANVFNTISTNVNLRRREFAMLKSVGMTNRSFNKMLNYECLLYGLKALLYGLPVATGVTYLIYQSVENGVDMDFYVPAPSIIISVFSVFFVVFVSMMYSMRKIRKENVLDALKNENI